MNRKRKSPVPCEFHVFLMVFVLTDEGMNKISSLHCVNVGTSPNKNFVLFFRFLRFLDFRMIFFTCTHDRFDSFIAHFARQRIYLLVCFFPAAFDTTFFICLFYSKVT